MQGLEVSQGCRLSDLALGKQGFIRGNDSWARPRADVASKLDATLVVQSPCCLADCKLEVLWDMLTLMAMRISSS